MDERHKILLLDDDPDVLDMYREILGQLSSKPEIHTATSGARGMAMLEAHEFRLLICDLKMPKMDGLQVLSIVRRKYPALRTVVLTSVADEQFRSRIYALGVDQFWQKPASEQEIKLFLECIESLLGPESEPGFRGVQSKSLVDLIQLECISQSSSTLRITNGPLTGKIWINNGDLIDAETDGARSEEAFQKILAWRAGSFETLPAEPARPRTIFKSYNALLLETAQVIDESRGEIPDAAPGGTPRAPACAPVSQIDRWSSSSVWSIPSRAVLIACSAGSASSSSGSPQSHPPNSKASAALRAALVRFSLSSSLGDFSRSPLIVRGPSSGQSSSSTRRGPARAPHR